MALFTASELGEWLQYQVTPEQTAIVERVVRGWLLDATGLLELPDPVPPQVFSWAIELGAMAHENPAGLSQDQSGETTSVFGVIRRQEIWSAARAWAAQLPGAAATSGGSPRGSFPPALPWPDPADRVPSCYRVP